METMIETNPVIKAHLFPLPRLILNPGGKITLNIFEPRYLKLLEDCMEKGFPMAIGHALSENGENCLRIPHEKYPYVYDEVGYGTVRVLAKTDANTKIVVIEGEGKAKIQSVCPFEAPFISVKLSPLEMKQDLDPMNTFLYRRMRGLTQDKLKEMVDNEREVHILMDQLQTPKELVAFYTDHLLRDFDTRMKVFSSNDINEKIQILGKAVTHH